MRSILLSEIQLPNNKTHRPIKYVNWQKNNCRTVNKIQMNKFTYQQILMKFLNKNFKIIVKFNKI